MAQHCSTVLVCGRKKISKIHIFVGCVCLCGVCILHIRMQHAEVASMFFPALSNVSFIYG